VARPPSEQRLAPTRVGLAIVAGALTGAIIVMLNWLTGGVWALGPTFIASAGARGAPIVLMDAFIAWLAGVILIGGPAWWLLHRHQLRSWRSAILTGVATTFAAGLILAVPTPHLGGGYSEADRGGVLVANGVLTAHGWLSAAQDALYLSVVGGAVGLVVWRVAYRRA